MAMPKELILHERESELGFAEIAVREWTEVVEARSVEMATAKSRLEEAQRKQLVAGRRVRELRAEIERLRKDS